MRVCVTGTTGFIGSALFSALSKENITSFGVVRSLAKIPSRPSGFFEVGDINSDTNWLSLLKGVDCVVHCAAMPAIGINSRPEKFKALRSVNVDGTMNLALQAASSGVRRFVFLSSIKVNGDSTGQGMPYTHDDTPIPADAYGISKLEAENGLQNIARTSGMEFAILRPPLVYGPGVGGNLKMLMKLVDYGVPLPLSNIRNQRSFIGIDNLVDLIITCIKHPQAANKILLASDDQDLSTTELLHYIAQAMGKSARLYPCPEQFFTSAAKCVGKSSLAEKLLGSLQVDISETKRLLTWVPPVSVHEGLSRCFPKKWR